jgi:uncharacterized protein (DUF1330 family)
MQGKHVVAMVIGSFVLGGVAVQTLHAQAKPPAYVIGEINVRNEDGYKNDFLPQARKPITDAGGKYIAGGFNKTASFDGDPPPNRVIILQFESMDAAKAWDASQANKDVRKIGDKYATFRTFAVEGVAP